MKFPGHNAGRLVRWGAIVALAAASTSWAQEASSQPPTTPSAPPTAPHAAVSESRALGIPKSLPAPRKARAMDAAPDGPASSGWLIRTVAPLAGVLALVIAGGKIMRSAARRWGGGGLRSALGAGGRSPAGLIEILGRYPVGRGVSLVLLKLDSRVLLLSQSAGGRFGAGAMFSTLAEVTDPEQVASILIKSRDAEGDSLAEKFRSMLQRFDRQIDAPAGSKDGALWDGTRSDIPVIDLTRRDSGRAVGTLRARLTQAKGSTSVGAIA